MSTSTTSASVTTQDRPDVEAFLITELQPITDIKQAQVLAKQIVSDFQDTKNAKADKKTDSLPSIQCRLIANLFIKGLDNASKEITTYLAENKLSPPAATIQQFLTNIRADLASNDRVILFDSIRKHAEQLFTKNSKILDTLCLIIYSHTYTPESKAIDAITEKFTQIKQYLAKKFPKYSSSQSATTLGVFSHTPQPPHSPLAGVHALQRSRSEPAPGN